MRRRSTILAAVIPILCGWLTAAQQAPPDTEIYLAPLTIANGRIAIGSAQNITNNPAALQKYQEAQAGMASALSRLMVVVEKYPELKATQGFRDLQFQLDQTENRVGTERRRYNEAAQALNTKRDSFPTVLIAGFFGSKFQPKAYFQSTPGSEKPPEVKF